MSGREPEPSLDQGAGEVERVRRRGALAEGLVPTAKEPVYAHISQISRVGAS